LAEDAGLNNGRVDVRRTDRSARGFREEFRRQKLYRLEHLKTLGLAEQVGVGQWRVDPDLPEKLLALGQRSGLAQEVRETLGRRYTFRDIAVYSKESPPERLIGEVVDRRRVDEVSEAERITVASTTGSLYRIALSPFSETQGEEARVGDIVQIRVTQRVAVSNADRNILRVAGQHDGIYDAETHRRWARQSPTIDASIDIEQYVGNHLKRLEGLERRGLVERIDPERFRVAPDLVARLESSVGAARDGGRIAKVDRLSALTLNEQVRAIGPTWLDRELVATGVPETGPSTIERRLAAAGRARLARLGGLGVVDPSAPRMTQEVLDRLYREEITTHAARLSANYGQYLRDPGATFSGRVERIESLASGAHAVVANEKGFVIVRARGALGRQLGRTFQLELGRPGHALARERTIQFVALELPSRSQRLVR
jgi:hypothetical protein